MPTIFYALIPVFAWGTWLAPSQNVRFNNQQIKTFYVGVANLGLAFLVAWLARQVRSTLQDSGLRSSADWSGQSALFAHSPLPTKSA